MFQALIQKAQGAVGSVVGKVLARAAVAIPIVIAAGFGIAALTVKLSQAYGPALSYTMMAGLFVGISGLTAVVRSRSESNNPPVPEEKTATLAENVAEVARPPRPRYARAFVDSGWSSGASSSASLGGTLPTASGDGRHCRDFLLRA